MYYFLYSALADNKSKNPADRKPWIVGFELKIKSSPFEEKYG